MFDYMGSSQLIRVSVSTGEIMPLGKPAHYTSMVGSPDGQFLLVSYLVRPYSYAVPCGRFPKRAEVWTRYVLLRSLQLFGRRICRFSLVGWVIWHA